MKKTLVLCMMLMLVGGLAFSQAQDLKFSNTVYTGFGSGLGTLERGETDAKFHGFTNYFTAHIDFGKLVLAGNIAWRLSFTDGWSTGRTVPNFSVVMKPLTGLDIGLGTNLEWEVGPKPSSGPIYSAYDVPYYAGLNDTNSRLNWGGVQVKNHFANDSFAIRYAFEDLIQVGFALHNFSAKASFDVGIGVKANILDLFTIGFAYNGNFKTSDKNSLYFGSTISAIKNIPIDIWLNFAPNGKSGKLGRNTIGGRVGIKAGSVNLFPEFSVTFFNADNRGASMYLAIDAYGTIAKGMLLGLSASWGLGSDPDTVLENSTAGARLNINPYFIWNLNSSNKLSIGVHIMPVWWQYEIPNQKDTNVYWGIPIAWKVSF